MTQYLIGQAHIFMAQAELARQLREAQLAGWRAGREAAAVQAEQVMQWTINGKQQADAIRAIPEPEEL